MDYIIKENITEFVGVLQNTVNETKEFVIEQAPMVVQEYLSWMFYSNLSWAVFWILIFGLISLIVLFAWIKSDDLEDESDKFGCRLFFTVIGGLLLFGSLLSGLSCVNEAIKVKIAPRIVILDKISTLIK